MYFEIVQPKPSVNLNNEARQEIANLKQDLIDSKREIDFREY